MLSSLALAAALQGSAPIHLDVDATQITRGIYSVTETFDAKPGPLVLCYPNWLPGGHSPMHSIAGILSFEVLADGLVRVFGRGAKEPKPNYPDERWDAELYAPWDIAFGPDGKVFISFQGDQGAVIVFQPF